MQALLLGILLFDQHISAFGFAAVFVTSYGMFLMSNLNLKKLELDKAALFGALAGLCLAIAAFNLKFASDQMKLLDFDNFSAAMLTLMWVILLQNIFFMIIKSSQKSLVKDLTSLFRDENRASFFKMSILSLLGAVLWFSAFTIGEVIYVKAVGQIELTAALLISWHLKEKHKPREFAGIAVTAIGILALIYFH